MIPVPDACLEKLCIKAVEDEKYRTLLNKEYQFCIKNQDKLLEKADHEYINKNTI